MWKTRYENKNQWQTYFDTGSADDRQGEIKSLQGFNYYSIIYIYIYIYIYI